MKTIFVDPITCIKLCSLWRKDSGKIIPRKKALLFRDDSCIQ